MTNLYIFLMYVLPPSQVHIVKPVQSRLQSIISATKTYVEGMRRLVYSKPHRFTAALEQFWL